MKKYIVNFMLFLIAYIIYSIIHEGSHAIFASIFNEYSSFKILPYGFCLSPLIHWTKINNLVLYSKLESHE